MHCSNASPVFINCRFLTNTAAFRGGGQFVQGSNARPSLSHCTFSDNQRTNNGGQIWVTNGAQVVLNNCIVWGVITNRGADIIVTNATLEASYCDLRGWTGGGAGNITNNPAFETGSPARLSASSPCIDQGTSNAIPGFHLWARYDMDGEARSDHASFSNLAKHRGYRH